MYTCHNVVLSFLTLPGYLYSRQVLGLKLAQISELGKGS